MSAGCVVTLSELLLHGRVVSWYVSGNAACGMLEDGNSAGLTGGVRIRSFAVVDVASMFLICCRAERQNFLVEGREYIEESLTVELSK